MRAMQEMNGRRWNGCRCACVAAAAGLAIPAALALAQPEPMNFAEAIEMEVLSGPLDLPGSTTGPRVRPIPPAPATAPGADAAAADGAEGAQSEEELPDWFGGKPWWQWQTVTGNWAGVRSRLETSGVSFAGSYTADYQGAWSGGLDQQSTYAHLIDLNMSFDLDALVGLQGGLVFVDFQSTAGDQASAFVGDFHGTTNLESDQSRDQLSEVWYEQWLFGDVLRLKAGKIDGNKEFNFTNASSEFLNAAAGLDTTNFMLPCYPDPATAVVAFVYPTEGWYVGFGFFDGAAGDGILTGGRGPATFFSDDQSDDFYYTAETGVTLPSVWFAREVRLAAGVWHHDGDFDRFDGGVEEGTTGFYALSEAQLWARAPEIEEDERGLYGFVRYGHADESVSDAANFIGTGLRLLGTIDARPDDSTGIFVGWTDLSDEAGAGFADDETVIECYYRAVVTPAIALTPDVQYIINPSGDPDADNVVVGGVRLMISF